MRKAISTSLVLGPLLLVAASLLSGFSAGPQHQALSVRAPWSPAELDLLASLQLKNLPPTPADSSNAVEGSPAAIELGRRLFNDVRFSQNQAVSCASCHDANKQFQDGLPLGRGVGLGARRAMPIVGSAHSPWLFWDGRKDSLWSQALGPLEDAVEHGGNRSRYAHLLQAHYRADYEAIFKPMPDLSALPQDAGPLGMPAEQAAWRRMDGKAQAEVSRVFANMGKAIAAYEKTLIHGESRFDRYVVGNLLGDASAQQDLTAQEIQGLRIFIGKGQCVSCHNGPLFTDQHFHNTAVPQRDPSRPDHGRASALAKVQQDEFNCLGRFSDAAPEQCQELRFMVSTDPALDGAFKTPSLRNVSLRPPYMHAGQFKTIAEVINHYVKAPAAVIGRSELSSAAKGRAGTPSERQPIQLNEQEIKDLADFLATLSGPILDAPKR
ncbi:cytochrome-c peroxidase [Roseateles oligotrophus]|uniref:Cytochrome-c peroxidase n=1 Tax=Roseateles oligotrophus TaxID=1769250 RepID=A0ABT2Y9D1_9BURK|nr:cytochrome c peroxidase [Roseateles oligotrophus]MCV2366893.1 cytochrome-c peroxidase [Roseateles oligotrophus]